MKVQDIFESSAFHADTTEMPHYDNMMQNPEYFEREKGIVSKLVQMSPKDYINEVSKAKNISAEELYNNRDPEKIEQYAEQMKTGGKKFPILTLDFSYQGKLTQEGLHRSFAAIKAGIKEVPVLVVRSTD